MADLALQLGPWSWLILGGLLLVVEIAVPGFFFLWVALAAGVVGVLAFLVQWGWQVEALIFAALSVLFVLLLRPHFKDKLTSSDKPNLNQRMLNHVGQTFELKDSIINGRGRLSIDGTLWDVEGPDISAGGLVRITGVSGMKFLVEAA